MKKVVFLIIVAFFATGAVFADHPGGFGIGVQGGGSGSWSGGGFGGAGALSLKFPSVPIFWAVSMSIGNGYFGLGVSGDYYFIDNQLFKTLHWYLGSGLGVGIWGFSDALGLGVSARLPVGLSWQPIPLLEVFLQIVPSLGVAILPEFHFPHGGFGGDLGIRLWF
jgi:hypothetical protein